MKYKLHIFPLLLALALLLGSVNVLALESDAVIEAEADQSLAAEEIVRVMVLLEDAGAAEALPDEAPGDTLFFSYQTELERTHDQILQDMEEAVPELQVVHDFTALFSGMSVDMPYGELSSIEKIDGVAEVWVATVYEAPTLSDTEASLAASFTTSVGAACSGQGTLIAMLDTGINLSHEAFQENAAILGQPLLTPASDVLTATSVSGAYVSDKIPFAYDYADRDTDVTDHNGHGSHVAGIAAGYAEAADGAITFTGAAPGAQLAIMKIFGDSSSSTTTDVYFAALQDAYLLGADVISMSLGTACGFTYDNNLDSVLFGNIYKTLDDAGIIVCCAAGNSGSQADSNSTSAGSVLSGYADYGTVASPSTYLGNISVANATAAATAGYTFEAGGAGYSYTEPSGEEGRAASLFGGTTQTYVPVSGTGTAEDFAAVDVAGKIALVSRGTLTFAQKVQNAADAGAAAIVIYNNTSTDVIMQISDPAIPALLVSRATGTGLINASEKVMYFHTEKQTVSSLSGQKIYYDSSWGTTPELTIAPALSATGVSISSASSSGSSSYVKSTGTSMAAPNVAGQFAVLLSYLKEAAPTLTKPQLSAMAESMAISSARLLGTDASPISVRRQGAGVMDAAAAISANAYIDTPLQELGDDPEETGVYTMTLTLKNPLLTGMTCAADRFSDISTTDWFHTEVDHMVHIGVFNGTGGDSFSPTRQLTRAEAVTALYRMAGSPTPKTNTTFTDVESGSYYEDAVAWAQENGITQGTGINRFSPGAPLTREQLVTLLYRYMGTPAYSGGLEAYLDEDAVEDYALDAWCWAVENGIVTSCSTQFLILNPTGVSTRAELAALLYRILDSLEPVSYTPEVRVYSDTVTSLSNALSLNPLSVAPLDCTVSYSCDTPIVFGMWTEDQTVTVTVTLTEEAKSTLRASFENGTYVEGYICFNGANETIHATFLSYFGDWDDAPILEDADFRDVAKAEDIIRKDEAYQGMTYFDLLSINTDANMAQLYCSNPNDTTYYKHTIGKLGDNPFSTSADYNEAHMAVTSAETNADYTYAQQVLVRTRSLRNAETLTYTVRDADTGEIYYDTALNYCSKSVYRSSYGTWSYSSTLYWSAEDLYGNPLPSGTNVIISVSASVRGQETHEQWSFPCTVDSRTPVVEYDVNGDQLTVTAQDDHYLAALVIYDESGHILASDYYSDDTAGTPHSLTIDLSTVSGSLSISARDYATNTTRDTFSP